jgi:hypothetical protein
MSIRIGQGLGCLLLILVVLGPGAIASIALHQASWAILLPLATIGILLGIAALPIGRNVSPEEYAVELERHLRGIDNDDEWDRTASVRVKNPRLEQLRRSLPDSFDDLRTEEDRMSLQRIIEELREGEFPDMPSKS